LGEEDGGGSLKGVVRRGGGRPDWAGRMAG